MRSILATILLLWVLTEPRVIAQTTKSGFIKISRGVRIHYHVLLGHVFDACLLACLDERIDASSISVDTLGAYSTGFEIGKVFFGRLRQRRALRRR